MELTNIEKYLTSLAPITSLFNSKQITPDEYIKAESFLAKKYCIKDDDIHRPNHLIIKGFRAIYMYGKKEENHGKEYNPNILLAGLRMVYPFFFYRKEVMLW